MESSFLPAHCWWLQLLKPDSHSKASQTPVTLYGYATSPFVQKVYTVLCYRQLQFETVFVNPITNQQLAFSGGRQVPALTIGDELRRESTAICFWLDEVFPQHSLTPDDPARQAQVEEICNWVDQRLIFVNFLGLNRLRNPLKLCIIGWRLGSVVRATSGTTTRQKWLWPLVLKKAKFIQRMVAESDWQGSVSELLDSNRQQLSAYLGDSDYLAGSSRPGIADCCAFGPLAHGYMLGSPTIDYYRQDPAIDAWFIRMSQHFDSAFGMIPEQYRRRQLPR